MQHTSLPQAMCECGAAVNQAITQSREMNNAGQQLYPSSRPSGAPSSWWTSSLHFWTDSRGNVSVKLCCSDGPGRPSSGGALPAPGSPPGLWARPERQPAWQCLQQHQACPLNLLNGLTAAVTIQSVSPEITCRLCLHV